MKFSASKRVVFILMICFVLLLLGGISLYFKDVISNGFKYGRWFTVDRYEELFDYCDYEKKGRDLSIKCNALVQSISVSEQNEKDICYKMLIISKTDNSLVDYSICGQPKTFQLINPYKTIESNKVLPVYLVLTGKLETVFQYSMNNIKMDTLSYEDLYTNPVFSTREFDYEKRIIYMGDFPSEGLYFGINSIHNESFGELTLIGTNLKNVTSDSEYVYLNLEGSLNGGKDPYNVTVKSKGFLIRERDGKYGKFIDSTNILEIPKWGRYSASFSYTTKSNYSNLEKFCQTNELDYPRTCTRLLEHSDSDFVDFINNSDDFFILLK